MKPSILVGDSPEEGGALNDVTAAARLSDGHIVVADGGMGASRLTLFGTDGQVSAVLGGTGDGPGEYDWITSVEVGAEDSVFVFDAMHQRLTLVDPHARRVSTLSVDPAIITNSQRFRAIYRRSDGSWIGLGLDNGRWGEPLQVARDTVLVGRLDQRLTTFHEFTSLPGPLNVRVEVEGRGYMGSPHFTPWPSVAAWGECAFSSAGESAEVEVHAGDRRALPTLELPVSPRPVTQEHVDDFRDRALARAPAETAPITRQLIEGAPRTTHLPFFSAMTTDPWGHLWLQEYQPPRGASTRWYVVSQTGQILTELTTPEPIRLLAVYTDGILARTTGPLDEQYVAFYPWVIGGQQMAAPRPECR
ncbi:MAG: hypothetical protein HKN72_02660 [Gemmatimonadetes bacterium]|nr:hypothetical protein [Gemmatimonadota bacterium]